VTTMTPGMQLPSGGQQRLAAGSWRVDPARSHASFAASVVGRPVRGCLPLSGGVLITEPIEDSTALLIGPGFLDAAAFPEISFRSELLAWVPAGWRVAGRLQVKNAEHDLACYLAPHLGGTRPDGSPRILITSSWVIDSRWITRQWIPGLGRRIVMTCSCSLEPDM
jgi:hypothetical protein